MKVLIATRNRDKAKEMKALLKEKGWEGEALTDIDPLRKIPDIEETGDTLLENALIKARTIFSITGVPTIADDTGLEVDALNGAPGVYAARYAGQNCSYEDNVNKLLSELRGVPPEKRSARFRTVVCYVNGSKELWSEGVVEGMISKIPKGENGFGYDPVFYIPEIEKTYAQLSNEEKNTISHRGKAMRKLLDLMSNELISTEHSVNLQNGPPGSFQKILQMDTPQKEDSTSGLSSNPREGKSQYNRKGE